MRLEKIRLAGFKSFVDPTSVTFPSNLVGIVGPNGCGKSNVIDAVRWVMGESSAKMLRGESMADVIFNGSTGRKPVGLASIELVFDNSDGGAGGEFAAFDQISVKRQVARDGQSGYFLNGARCRRRDIQDLFLGTGLGPRSYAIIEQGMISRIIEARPEELRLFIEEAAGISKYRERRRETENRMRHTRENLDRLNDLRDEVGKQLTHLERQAAIARQYTQLRAEERRLDLELKALRWRALDDELQRLDHRLTEAENLSEGGVARQERLQADIDAQRAEYDAAADVFNEVQGRYYAVGAEIARAEQAIQFANEERGRREAELVRLEQERHEAEHDLERDQARLSEIAAALTHDTPQLKVAESTLGEAMGALMNAEDQLEGWESEWDAFNQTAAKPSQQAQLERARITALEQGMDRDRARSLRIAEEITHLETGDVATRIEDTAEQTHALEERLATLETREQAASERVTGHDTALRELTDTLDGLRTQLQESKGRLASLSALQDAAMADNDSARVEWLARHGLANAPRLVDYLSVQPGWEQAVERVLGETLRAIGAPGLDACCDDSGALPAGLVLIDTDVPAQAHALNQPVSAPWPLAGLLGEVRFVETLADAFKARAALERGASVVVRDGTRIGRNWLSVPTADTGDSVLARADALKALRAQIDTLVIREDALLERESSLRLDRAEVEQRRAQTAHESIAAARELSTLNAELSSLRTRREHQSERLRVLAEERAELAEQCAQSLEEIAETRERLHELLSEVELLVERRETMERERVRLRAAVVQSREYERTCQEQTQRLRINVESNRAAQDATEQSLARAQLQQQQLERRHDDLQAQLQEGVEPLIEQRDQLDVQLALRVDVEEALQTARQRRESLDAEVRRLELERQRTEQDVHASQRGLDTLRMERQEWLVRQRTLEEQLAETGANPAGVLESLDPEASEAPWKARLAKITACIQRLGAVNLAAIDEFQEHSQRKVYLDTQHADISRSLETLEHAIRKIDRETRSRFKATYDQVDASLQQLFPQLFGGGQAYLELTGEDLLETGVTVMARPPGKRNSSIHLLSGGEKALTAVALVFAIFQLNPAPFCMLDEVDAPLDDANVGRFCELVRSLSDRVQFIFISHNKVTMEMATHLLGVTMQEPGVSRLVGVDVDEAVSGAKAHGARALSL